MSVGDVCRLACVSRRGWEEAWSGGVFHRRGREERSVMRRGWEGCCIGRGGEAAYSWRRGRAADGLP